MSKPIKFDHDDNTEYEYLDWQELGDIATALAVKIIGSGTTYDRIIALASGGHTMSKALKDYLDIPKISSMQISFYTGINKRGETPIITQSLATSVEGEHLLVFDDVNDTGSTLETARKYLELRGAASITTATLTSKTHSSFPSDYYGRELNSWIIFPDEVRETISFLMEKWDKQGIDKSEIRERLITIGFSDQHLQVVLSD